MKNHLVHGAFEDLHPESLRMPANLVEALRRARTVDRFGLGFVQADLSTRDLTWRQIVIEAEHRGARLLQLGLCKGQRLGMFVHEDEPFVLTFLGAVLVGLVPVPMSPPSPIGSMELQRQRIVGILNRSGASSVVGPAGLTSTLEPLPGFCPALKSWVTYERLAERNGAPDVLPVIVDPAPDDLALLQFTSGSTSQPKGVEVTHRNLMANTEALHELLGTDVERRVGVTWAPLFHDMGLIGSLIPTVLFHGRHIFIPTMMFVRKPQIWLETIHRYRATITTANNYALRAAAKRSSSDTSLDLTSLRVIVIGGEPIHPDVAESFVEALRPRGLNEAVLSPAYGMAEATLAVSATQQNERLRVIEIARDAYECDRRVRLAGSGEPSLRVVDCGTVLPGHEIAVVDPQLNLLPQDHVGELLFRGPSVCRGYYNDPEASQAVFQDGWLRTGDLGFVHENRVFVSGRLKDLIIIAGRNHYPQDIETLVSHVEGVSHHVIAFSVSGAQGEQLVVLCERFPSHDLDGLERRVREAIIRELGVLPYDVVVSERGTLPQTTSGKPQRRQAREHYLNNSRQHSHQSE